MSTQLPPETGPSGPEPTPPGGGGPRVVRRSRSEKLVAGVCGGVGRYLGVDPVLLRIAFIILALANGLGVIAYVVAWVAIPEERPGQPLAPAPAAPREGGRVGSPPPGSPPPGGSCSGRWGWWPSGPGSCWGGCGDDAGAGPAGPGR